MVSTRSTISAGTSFEATEMTPRPPSAISGNVNASSPDSTTKCLGTTRQISAICVMLPDASLTPTMFLSAERRNTVAGSMLQPVRPGTLYRMIGSEVLSAIAR